MYTKILVPLDGSALAERAVPHAVELARSSGAEITLLEIIRGPIADAPEAGQAEEDRAIREAAGAAQVYLDTVAIPLRGKGLKVRVVIRDGDPASGILEFAHKEDVDVIVMSTHGRSGLSRVIMGSVAEKVVLTTKRPVMLVKPERQAIAAHLDEADTFLSAH